jgi:hypothetical protein
LAEVDAVLGGFVSADENYGNIPSKALSQNSIFINVDFAEVSVKFPEQRSDGGLGFFAKMASGARIERDVARAASCKPRIFG